MPFWKRKADPEVEAARARAEAALPPGWRIHRSDLESFWIPAGQVITYGICAGAPTGEKALVLAVGEVNAFHHFERFMRGELETAEGWAIPLDTIERRTPHPAFRVKNEDDHEVVAAKRELEAALPAGWQLYNNDRERYFFPEGSLETYAVTARGPGDETKIVMGVGEAGAFRQMMRALRGELTPTEAWAPLPRPF